ncbi:hypothetical protein SAMN06296273_1115 [Nitrosomonas ureae]|uniref:Uncharacterized protein n=1 Tax=Nitrosomonas ureae TaxID=44577 RepID=A0A285BWK9_9PROT|nr:hypothetical protein [Nitrosomonas ureae]SNX59677.1 hypothetical protein SAMN06296273_1115 [Nitrosomonas ureae]
MCIEQFIEISKALLTPTIAVVTTYIAYQQWKINRQKLFLDLYDRRLKVYEEVRQILGIVVRDAGASYDDLLKFRKAVSEADFLFEPEISKYIEEIYQHGVKLQSWNKQYRDSTQPKPYGYDHQKVCEGIETELNWLTQQFEPTKQKFKKYLNISY